MTQNPITIDGDDFYPHGTAIIVHPVENEPISGIIIPEHATGDRRGVFVSMGERGGITAAPGDIIHYKDSAFPFFKEENIQVLHQNNVIAVKHADGTMSSPDGTILVTTDGSMFNDTLKYGSLELHVPANEPNWTHAAKTKLTVAGVSGTTGVVSAGEQVFVNYGVVLNEHLFVTIDGRKYWKAFCAGSGGDIHAVEREGSIVPLFGWVLVEPAVENDEVDSTLIIPEKSRKSETTGTIKYVCDCKTNPKLEVGMKVLFSDKDAFENDFNGEKLYTMKAERINFIFNE